MKLTKTIIAVSLFITSNMLSSASLSGEVNSQSYSDYMAEVEAVDFKSYIKSNHPELFPYLESTDFFETVDTNFKKYVEENERSKSTKNYSEVEVGSFEEYLSEYAPEMMPFFDEDKRFQAYMKQNHSEIMHYPNDREKYILDLEDRIDALEEQIDDMQHEVSEDIDKGLEKNRIQREAKCMKELGDVVTESIWNSQLGRMGWVKSANHAQVQMINGMVVREGACNALEMVKSVDLDFPKAYAEKVMNEPSREVKYDCNNPMLRQLNDALKLKACE